MKVRELVLACHETRPRQACMQYADLLFLSVMLLTQDVCATKQHTNQAIR